MELGRLNILLLLALCFGGLAEARELDGPDVGVVPFGMGRAYSAIADDWLALHYNPAGLSLVKKVDLQFFDIRLGSNRDVVQSYSNVSNMGKSSNSLANTLNSFVGKHVMADFSNQSQITIPHFAFGLGYDIHADVDLQNSAYPITYTRYTKDLTFKAGTGVALDPKNNLRIGTTLKVIHRTGGARYLTVGELAGNKATLKENFMQNGSGFGGDVGMQYRFPGTGRIEVTGSFVWYDVGKTSFGGAFDQNRPTRIEDNMVVGMGVRFPIGGRKNRRLERRYGPDRSTSSLSFAFDYSHLNYSIAREHLPKHLHLGMNLDLPILSLQLGMNQTALTAGMGFDLWMLKVNVATYGEELGNYGGQRVDRRYLLSVGSSFGFKGF